jgi:hypothetical protein
MKRHVLVLLTRAQAEQLLSYAIEGSHDADARGEGDGHAGETPSERTTGDRAINALALAIRDAGWRDANGQVVP